MQPWRPLVADDPDAQYTMAPAAGRNASVCTAYRKTAEGFANSHFDQDFDAEPGKTYAFGAWIRGHGTLKPHLRIADENWNTIAVVPTTQPGCPGVCRAGPAAGAGGSRRPACTGEGRYAAR